MRPPPSAAILKGEVLSVICVLFMFLIDYVKILQLVAICAIIFVTVCIIRIVQSEVMNECKCCYAGSFTSELQETHNMIGKNIF